MGSDVQVRQGEAPEGVHLATAPATAGREHRHRVDRGPHRRRAVGVEHGDLEVAEAPHHQVPDYRRVLGRNGGLAPGAVVALRVACPQIDLLTHRDLIEAVGAGRVGGGGTEAGDAGPGHHGGAVGLENGADDAAGTAEGDQHVVGVTVEADLSARPTGLVSGGTAGEGAEGIRRRLRQPRSSRRRR